MKAVMNYTVPQLSVPPMALRHAFWSRLTLSDLHDYTQTDHIRQESSGRVWSVRRSDLYLTMHSYATGGIQTHNPSERAATDHYEMHSVMAFFFSIVVRALLVYICVACVETLWSIALLLQETLAQIQPVSKTPDCRGAPCPIQVFCNCWITTLRCVSHPRCVGAKTKNFCLLHLQSNTTVFHLVIQ